MKNQKSKSNILNLQKNQKQFLALNNKKQNKRHDTIRKPNPKYHNEIKNKQQPLKNKSTTKKIKLKSKSYLEKMTLNLSKHNDKSQMKSSAIVQRRKSISTISQRPDSRISKRGSVVSTKQNKDKKCQNDKQNNKNLNNLNEVEEQLNQEVLESLKKSIKNIKSKKKFSLNLNPKHHAEISNPKKGSSKTEKNNIFQRKLSKNINQKQIFTCRQVDLKQINRRDKSSKSKKVSKEKKQQELQKTQNKQRQNLLQIYQFYKKTFDINFSNCMKKGSNMTKIDKNHQSSSKNSIQPFYSAVVLERNEHFLRNSDRKSFQPQKNQTHVSIVNPTKEIQQCIKSGDRNLSLCEKQKQQMLRLQKSQFYNSNSKSKSRVSNVNSESSTKDNVIHFQQSTKDNCMYFQQLDRQKVDHGQEERLGIRKNKKSYKQLLVYNQNNQNIEPKQQQKMKQSSIKLNKSLNTNKETNEAPEFHHIEICQSNIKVLNWGSKQQEQKESFKDKLCQKLFQLPKEFKQSEMKQQITANFPIASDTNPKLQIQESTNEKQAEKKNVSSLSLEQLSSISIIYDRKQDHISYHSVNKTVGYRFFEVEDTAFEL